MKAVVVEIENDLAAVFSDDGCVIKLHNNNYVIGQVIELKERTTFNPKRIFALAASAVAAVIVFSVGAWAYYTPYSYVSLDVNPSIGYSVNRLDRVVDARAINGDGEEIIKNLNLKNKKIQDAVKETVKEIADNGYFSGDTPGGIIITTASENTQKGEELANTLEKSIKQTVGMSTIGMSNVQLEVQNVALERVQKARELGVTPGKLHLVEKLQQSAVGMSSINVNQWLNMPVKDIMKATKDFKEVAKETEKSDKNSSSKADEIKSDKKPASIGSSSISTDKSSSKSDKTSSNSSDKSEDKNSKADKSEKPSNSATPASSSKSGDQISGASNGNGNAGEKKSESSQVSSEKTTNGNNKSDSASEKSNNGSTKK